MYIQGVCLLLQKQQEDSTDYHYIHQKNFKVNFFLVDCMHLYLHNYIYIWTHFPMYIIQYPLTPKWYLNSWHYTSLKCITLETNCLWCHLAPGDNIAFSTVTIFCLWNASSLSGCEWRIFKLFLICYGWDLELYLPQQ